MPMLRDDIEAEGSRSMDEVGRDTERRGGERRGADSSAARRLRVRWGKVVREDEKPDQPAREPWSESPGKRVARDRRRSVRRRRTRLHAALAVLFVLIAILVLQAIENG